VAGATDAPTFRLHFSADAPLTIRALLFAPETNPEKNYAARQMESNQSGVSLYSRRVLIQVRRCRLTASKPVLEASMA